MTQAFPDLHHAPSPKQHPHPPQFTAGGITYTGVYSPSGSLVFVPAGCPLPHSGADDDALAFSLTPAECVRVRATISRAVSLLRERQAEAVS